MGNSRSALKMIMEELHDVDKAIEFAKEQDDGELWEDLILYSIDKPRKQKSHLQSDLFLSIRPVTSTTGIISRHIGWKIWWSIYNKNRLGTL